MASNAALLGSIAALADSTAALLGSMTALFGSMAALLGSMAAWARSTAVLVASIDGGDGSADAGWGARALVAAMAVRTDKRAAGSTDLGIETSRGSAPAAVQGYGRQQG